MITILTASLIALASCIILTYVQTVQNVPYMDEIFHIPQAKQYCAYNFSSWDPMITTLPGLYLFSLVQLLPFASLQGVSLSEVCTTQILRASNLTYCIGNFVLLLILCKKLTGDTQVNKSAHLHVLSATVLVLFPVLYFFTWLYYTDPGSTFFTLLMYALCLYGRHNSSAAVSVAAVIFRQTNVIWVLFCIGMVVIEVIDQQLRLDKKIRGNLNNLKDIEVLKLILQTAFSSPAKIISIVKELFIRTFCYICVLIGFSVFVIVNKGIVVGDKSHHEASYNFPQVFYFLTTSAAFSFIHFINPRQIVSFLQSVIRNPLKVLLFAVLAGFLVKMFTYEHRYLLSDNRHYTFYIWSRIFKRNHLARYALIPVYMFSLYQFYSMTLHKGLLWRIVFSFCTLACLVPQALLEFRYFIIPFYILRLNMKLPTVKVLMAELVFYVSINAFTVYMFTQRPFYWPENPEPQRFMW
uniref:Dol-P-Glc:Glc(2)Man(9)GlcNAc(2)-PP-Dol alpha-1,2-glucosyltransferase n=1 Tax=Arion vulgaris TaxID=1028688 RepID=A0A0B7A7B3_9EUPU